jgi:hypothetical protein
MMLTMIVASFRIGTYNSGEELLVLRNVPQVPKLNDQVEPDHATDQPCPVVVREVYELFGKSQSPI